MNGQRPPFYGKYRGIVTNNNDTTFPGRIRARVPDVLGSNESGWAMPCVPYAGKGVGMFFIPPVGASVWIEFEHGDPEYPIWSGCFWANPNELPFFSGNYKPGGGSLVTNNFSINFDDVKGKEEILITSFIGSGAMIIINAQGIEITSSGQGKIKLTTAGVSINDGALEVM